MAHTRYLAHPFSLMFSTLMLVVLLGSCSTLGDPES